MKQLRLKFLELTPEGKGNIGNGVPSKPPSPLWKLPKILSIKTAEAHAPGATQLPHAALVAFKLPKISSAAQGSKESSSATSMPQITRACESFKFLISQRFMESDEPTTTTGSTRYRVIMIAEGLGNMKDGFYYTAQALQESAPRFEGQKCYANHPSSAEEVVLPERDVRDIVGHFENVAAIPVGDHIEIQGDLVIMDGPPYAWVRNQLDHALEFSKKHSDKDFIGLSINAGGLATPMTPEEFQEQVKVPDSCRAKVAQAVADGLSVIKVVESIDQAISCDLVTQAGAGGRVLQAI